MQIEQTTSAVNKLSPPACIAIVFLLVLQGCGWIQKISFRSPSGRAEIQILQPRIENEWGMEIYLVTAGHRRRVYKSPNEAYLYFAQVAWSANESVVGVLVTGFGTFPLAFDVRSGDRVPFERIKKEIASAISETYKVPPELDSIRWAESNDGWHEFAKRYPAAKSR